MFLRDEDLRLMHLDVYKNSKKQVDEERPENSLKISPSLLSELVEFYDETIQFNPSFQIQEEPRCCSPCGCLGPKTGGMYCPCRLTTLLYEFRFDVLIHKISQTHLD